MDPLDGEGGDGGFGSDVGGDGGRQKSTKMSLDIAFNLLGWGKDDWPSASEVRKRHRDLMLKKHPDKAPLGKEEEYTQITARLNHARDVVLRAHGLADAEDEEDAVTTQPPATFHAPVAPVMEEGSARLKAEAGAYGGHTVGQCGSQAGEEPARAARGHGGGEAPPQQATSSLPPDFSEAADDCGHTGHDSASIPCRQQEAAAAAAAGAAGGLSCEPTWTELRATGGLGCEQQCDTASRQRSSLVPAGVSVAMLTRGGLSHAHVGGLSHAHVGEAEAGGSGRGGLGSGVWRNNHIYQATSMASGVHDTSHIPATGTCHDTGAGTRAEVGESGSGDGSREASACESGRRSQQDRPSLSGSVEEDDEHDECVLVTMRSVVPSWSVILSNLKLLAQVRESDKLAVSGETIAIDTSGALGGVSRWLCSQGRSQTVSWLLRFSSDLVHFVQLLLAGIAFSADEQAVKVAHGGASFEMSRSEMLRTVAWEMGPCVQGIRRLRSTYSTDSAVVSRLDRVIREISESRESVFSWLQLNGYPEGVLTGAGRYEGPA